MPRILLLGILLLISCKSSLNQKGVIINREDYKDVFLLAVLIEADLQATNEREIDITKLVKNDKRIRNSFEKVELKPKGGHISVYYTLSNTRDNEKIELSEEEKGLIHMRKWISKKKEGLYDGEIQFEYGERFYHRRKIILFTKS